MVTRDDVAKHAGVSVAVVSYVINNKAIVKEETRQKVLRSIEALGYNPNLAARSLKTKRTNQYGVLFNNLGNPFETGISLGLEEKARELGQSLIFQTFLRAEEEKLKTIFMGRTDGLILLGQSLQETTVQYFGKLGLPVYSITTPVHAHPSVRCIDIDWYKAMTDLLRHLKELGHTRIAFMGNANAEHPHHVRYLQFRRALEALGLSFDPASLMQADGRLESAYGVMKSHLADTSRLAFSAIVCANDLMAIGVLSACKDRGLAVPRDLSVAGCENILMASHTTPSLTTIHYPRRESGFLAVERILRREGGDAAQEAAEHLEHKLIVRESTGECRA